MINVGSALRGYVRWLPTNQYLLVKDLRNKLRIHRHPRLTYDKSAQLFVCHDGETAIHFCHMVRAGRYVGGIRKRAELLAAEYLLDLVDFVPGDVMVDCGANVGELGIWANERELCYVPVEPEDREADCIDLNVFGGETRTIRKALWMNNTKLTFYSAPETADSSLIDPGKYDSVREVEAITVAELMASEVIDTVKLLKIDAEGAEPEVLLGCASVIDRIEYIVVECGFERGPKQASPIWDVYNFCMTNGLEFVNIRGVRLASLFRNPGFRK